jgi:hypothetical protein
MKHAYIVFLSMSAVSMFIATAFGSIGTAVNSNMDAQPSNVKMSDEVVNTWSLSRKTCAPSSASVESTVTLKVDVTSFSSSKCAGDTVMSFIVSGRSVHTVDVGGTGIYTYSYTVDNTPGNINFHAKYLSGSEFFEGNHRIGMVLFRNSYSDFGDSNIHVNNYLDEIGYDGNDTIYLSNTSQATEPIYGYINLTGVANSGTLSGGICPNVVIGNESYTEVESGNKLIIEIKIGESGAGKIMCSFNAKSGEIVSSYPDKMTFSIEISGNGPRVDMLKHSGNEYGMNITSSGKAVTEENDEVSLMMDGLSLVPYYGYVITAGEAAGTAYNLIHCLTSKGASSSNNQAGETFHLTGGNYSASDKCSYVKSGQNVYSAGTCAYICIPNSDLSVNRTMTLKYQNYYVQGSSLLGLKAGAAATDTVNAVTSSAIYGAILNESTAKTDHISNVSLYMKDVNNGDVYNVTIHHGHYLFFAKPDTEYKIYYETSNGFKLLKTIDASNLTAGSGYHCRIYSDEL